MVSGAATSGVVQGVSQSIQGDAHRKGTGPSHDQSSAGCGAATRPGNGRQWSRRRRRRFRNLEGAWTSAVWGPYWQVVDIGGGPGASPRSPTGLRYGEKG